MPSRKPGIARGESLQGQHIGIDGGRVQSQGLALNHQGTGLETFDGAAQGPDRMVEGAFAYD